MKTFLTSVLLFGLVLSTIALSAHMEDSPSQFDSYGAIPCDDAKSRLNAFAVELQNQPNMMGYVVVYPERDGLLGPSEIYMDFATSYLEITCGIPHDRLHTVVADDRDHLTTELWIAPPGSALPVAAAPKTLAPARILKYDEGVADYTTSQGEQSLWTYVCGLGGAYFTGFARKLQSEPNSIGRIVIHLERGKRSNRAAHIMAYLLRNKMVKNEHVDSHRIVIVNGGRRETPMVELWLLRTSG